MSSPDMVHVCDPCPMFPEECGHEPEDCERRALETMHWFSDAADDLAGDR